MIAVAGMHNIMYMGKDEGGRHTPFFNNYRPQFYFRTTDVTGVCELPEGVEMCMPGDNVEVTIELIHPVAMEEGLGFAIREGGRLPERRRSWRNPSLHLCDRCHWAPFHKDIHTS